jgi:hypothetical protein
MSHAFTNSLSNRVTVLNTPAGISRAFHLKGPQPHPVYSNFQAIWDTGATGSVISERVVNACGLQPTGMTKAQTASGECICPVFMINLLLPNNVTFQNWKVSKMDMGLHTDVLIGMDIIGLGDFAVTHADGKTCFSFRVPSSKKIDFVAEHHLALKNRVGRNEPCPCGSGKKFKNCCLNKM